MKIASEGIKEMLTFKLDNDALEAEGIEWETAFQMVLDTASCIID